MSVAYCKRCLEENAHPFAYLRANLGCALHPDTAERWEDPEVIKQEYIDALNTYYQGRYMTLREALRLQPFTRDELAEHDRLYRAYCEEHSIPQHGPDPDDELGD